MAPIHSVRERRHPACTPNSLSECEAHHKLKGRRGGGSQPSIIRHIGGPVMSRGWRRTCPWCCSAAMLLTGGSPQAGEQVPQVFRSYTVIKVTMPVFFIPKTKLCLQNVTQCEIMPTVIICYLEFVMWQNYWSDVCSIFDQVHTSKCTFTSLSKLLPQHANHHNELYNITAQFHLHQYRYLHWYFYFLAIHCIYLYNISNF